MPTRLQIRASRAAAVFRRSPKLFCRMAFGKLNAMRAEPRLPAQIRVGEIVFECTLAHYRGTGPMYFGSYAPLAIEALKKYLSPGDTFFDVGANVGYLSAAAANFVGVRGQVHCFEPVPIYFERLRRLAELNPQHAFFLNRSAAGEENATSMIFVTREPGQNTLVTGYKSASEVESTFEVRVRRLDEYIGARGLDRIAMIKIDAEGFELPILKGLQDYFERSLHRPAILCEIAPRAYPLMGRSRKELVSFMAAYGYTARDLVDGSTPVDICTLDHVEDVLFLADEP